MIFVKKIVFSSHKFGFVVLNNELSNPAGVGTSVVGMRAVQVCKSHCAQAQIELSPICNSSNVALSLSLVSLVSSFFSMHVT